MGILTSGFLHHSEPADPDLINWLLDSFDNLVGLSSNVFCWLFFFYNIDSYIYTSFL
ncbi:MAG: hypothetical protein CM1200mP3_00150 [Chloroflexota bacterium]|nr:MAG: hypothetical protein CM1200mP3_00150 [Chloroflexota bacterium]